MGRKPRYSLVIADTDVGGVIHVANIKGGVGKSTVATNLAATLAKHGRTLVIDLDVQGSATVALGCEVAPAGHSSWVLFARRFSPVEPHVLESAQDGTVGCSWVEQTERTVFGWVVGTGDVRRFIKRIGDDFDVIPAGPDLFRTVSGKHLANLRFNIDILRSIYKYIVIDTPSIWNETSRELYRASDVNLVPVTLNALSTKSLRDYLRNVKALAEHNRSIRVRIVKNEVFGKAGTKLRGKARTMNENRMFLERLCEQIVVSKEANRSLVPQTILLDLEIPETAAVRDAQDEGVAVNQLHQYALVSRAFEKLAEEVQHVLNNYAHQPLGRWWERSLPTSNALVRVAAVAAVAFLFGMERPAGTAVTPRPVAPQQVMDAPERVLECKLGDGESLYRLAKYAICRFRATVPSRSELDGYTMETVETHNRTRIQGEAKLGDLSRIPAGTVIRFYPPTRIRNPLERQLLPVYEYFTKIVRDPYAYITGDWCERGEGGGEPHYGIDVAAALGTRVISPIDGVAVVHYSRSYGRTLGIVNNNSIIFFSHLGDISYSTGDRIRRGAVVGSVGMTGRTSGPHIHVGYGVRSLSEDGTVFGGKRYKLTDPKLFFYREEYLGGLDKSS